MTDPRTRHLPSADWLAFGIGVTALFAQYLFPPAQTLIILAVFTPSLLREIGALHDADEWTTRVMYRAGFHAALTAVLLLVLGGLAPLLHVQVPQGGFEAQDAFGGETLRRAIVWVFLISYLLQYWGARTGAFRVLLGVAVLNVAPILAFLRRGGDMTTALVGSALAAAAVFLTLAFVVRRFPKAGGRLLLGLCLLVFVFAMWNMRDARIAWGQVSLILQAFLVLGVTGIALVVDPERSIDEKA
jgi:hypothetical protein